jgi:hypothetical protein
MRVVIVDGELKSEKPRDIIMETAREFGIDPNTTNAMTLVKMIRAKSLKEDIWNLMTLYIREEITAEEVVEEFFDNIATGVDHVIGDYINHLIKHPIE